MLCIKHRQLLKLYYQEQYHPADHPISTPAKSTAATLYLGAKAAGGSMLVVLGRSHTTVGMETGLTLLLQQRHPTCLVGGSYAAWKQTRAAMKSVTSCAKRQFASSPKVGPKQSKGWSEAATEFGAARLTLGLYHVPSASINRSRRMRSSNSSTAALDGAHTSMRGLGTCCFRSSSNRSESDAPPNCSCKWGEGVGGECGPDEGSRG